MKTALVVIVAVLALMAGMYAGLSGSTVPEQATLSFAFPDSAGKLQDVSQWRGKTLVINFWASWCGPCKQEIPEFVRLQQQYASKDVQFIGIAVDDRQPVLEFLQQVDINYPILIAGDAGAALASQLGNIIGVLPFTVVVNRQGQIVHRQPGEMSKTDFIEVIEPVLAGKADKLQ